MPLIYNESFFAIFGLYGGINMMPKRPFLNMHNAVFCLGLKNDGTFSKP